MPIKKDPREASFTLMETMMAMTIMITVILRVVGTQGTMEYNSTYAKKMSEAIWLAKGLMSKVEYFWEYQDFEELEKAGGVKREKFRELKLQEDFDYTYSMNIEEWKFPILDLLEAGGVDGEAGEDDQPVAPAFPIKDILKSVLGDHILKIAHVEVFWPEGAKENSVTLTYLLTNQRRVDEHLKMLEPQYKKLIKHVQNEGKKKKPPKNDKQCREADESKPFFNRNTKKCVEEKPQ